MLATTGCLPAPFASVQLPLDCLGHCCVVTADSRQRTKASLPGGAGACLPAGASTDSAAAAPWLQGIQGQYTLRSGLLAVVNNITRLSGAVNGQIDLAMSLVDFDSIHPL